MKIQNVVAREILDSRGNPTIETTVTLQGGTWGTASVPSGASTGIYEALELRDGDKTRYGGKGVQKAVQHVNGPIRKALVGVPASFYEADRIMMELDGTENKEKLGANALLSVSLAVAKAAAKTLSIPLYRYIGGAVASTLPVPMMNILNGGAHADNNLDVQEFMIVPIGFSRFSDALRAGAEIYHTLGDLLRRKGKSTAVGDEGGFAPDLTDTKEAIETILEAVTLAGYSTDQVKIALDVAASEWAEGDAYRVPKRNQPLSFEQLVRMWDELTDAYPILSIEDGVGETDREGWKLLTKTLGGKIMLVGDDLFVTNPERLREGIRSGTANTVLVKPNQVGTLTETLEVIRLAKNAGYRSILSHRSGETGDTAIADIAVGTNAGFIKTGAPCRYERVAKYNRLLKIEEELGTAGHYSGC